jgi:hypothetical protein
MLGFVTIFQMITLEGWYQLMTNLMDAGYSWVALLFSIVLVIVCSFFLLKIVLAFLAESIEKTDNESSDMHKNESIVDSLLMSRKFNAKNLSKDDIVESQKVDFFHQIQQI